MYYADIFTGWVVTDGVFFVCLLLWGGGRGLGEREGGGGSEGFRDCVYVGMRVCACVDAVRGEGDRVRHAFVN